MDVSTFVSIKTFAWTLDLTWFPDIRIFLDHSCHVRMRKISVSGKKISGTYGCPLSLTKKPANLQTVFDKFKLTSWIVFWQEARVCTCVVASFSITFYFIFYWHVYSKQTHVHFFNDFKIAEMTCNRLSKSIHDNLFLNEQLKFLNYLQKFLDFSVFTAIR